MPRPIDENLERQIVRHLDGQMPEADKVGFFRQVLRDPESRRVMDDYAHLDQLAGDALRAALAGERLVRVPNLDATADREPVHSPWSWGWQRGLAMAAALALAAGLTWALLPRSQPNPPADPLAVQPASPAGPAAQPAPKSGIARLSPDGQHVIRQVTSDFVGVYDEERNELYLLELQHEQIIAGQAAHGTASGAQTRPVGDHRRSRPGNAAPAPGTGAGLLPVEPEEDVAEL